MSHMPKDECHETDLSTCATDVWPNSRLTCEIKVSHELQGLVIRLPYSA